MTVEQFWKWAEENGLKDYEVEIQYRDDGGNYVGTDTCLELIVNVDRKVIIL
jgi:hypothetical protein